MKTYQIGKSDDMGKLRVYQGRKIGILVSWILFFLTCLPGFSQSCEITLRNDLLIDANNLIVDIYVRSTSGTFYYSSGQYKVTYNKASILNGGTITGSIVPGYSELTNTAQIPTTVNTTASTYWRVTALWRRLPQGPRAPRIGGRPILPRPCAHSTLDHDLRCSGSWCSRTRRWRGERCSALGIRARSSHL